MNVNLAVPYNAVPSPPRSGDLFFYAPTQSDFLFREGDAITILCDVACRPLALSWALCRNGTHVPLATGRGRQRFDNTFEITLSTSALPPGFYDLRVHVQLTGAESRHGVTTFGWRPEEEALIDVRPADFAAFWEGARRAVSRTPLDLRCSPVRTLRGEEIGRYNVAHAALPERYDPDGERCGAVDLFRVDFGAPGGGRVHGWFARPVGAGPFPGMLVLPGAGNAARPAPVEHARHGYAALDIQVHGWPVDQASYPGLPERDKVRSPEQHGDYAMYSNALQAVNALASLPGVDTERLAVGGGSQGGRLALVVAALDPRLRAAVPALAHFGYRPYVRWVETVDQRYALQGDKAATVEAFTAESVPRDARTLVESYYDVMHFASLVRCPVLMNAGLIDPVSLPTCVFAVFRRLPGPKEIVPLPNLAHDWSPAFDRYAWRWLSLQLA